MYSNFKGLHFFNQSISDTWKIDTPHYRNTRTITRKLTMMITIGKPCL